MNDDQFSGSCACIGPQNGQPLCPCAMRGVVVRNGRYIIPERDLGPVVRQNEKELSVWEYKKRTEPPKK